MAAMGAFLFGRAGSTLLLKYINPGKLMFYYALAGITLTLGTILLQGISGLYCLIVVAIYSYRSFKYYIEEAWPNGQARRTSRGRLIINQRIS